MWLDERNRRHLPAGRAEMHFVADMKDLSQRRLGPTCRWPYGPQRGRPTRRKHWRVPAGTPDRLHGPCNLRIPTLQRNTFRVGKQSGWRSVWPPFNLRGHIARQRLHSEGEYHRPSLPLPRHHHPRGGLPTAGPDLNPIHAAGKAPGREGDVHRARTAGGLARPHPPPEDVVDLSANGFSGGEMLC
jgi:hypothetical protein